MGNGETIYDSLKKEPLLDRGVSFTYRDKARESEAFLISKGKSRHDFLLEAFGIGAQSSFGRNSLTRSWCVR